MITVHVTGTCTMYTTVHVHVTDTGIPYMHVKLRQVCFCQTYARGTTPWPSACIGMYWGTETYKWQSRLHIHAHVGVSTTMIMHVPAEP